MDDVHERRNGHSVVMEMEGPARHASPKQRVNMIPHDLWCSRAHFVAPILLQARYFDVLILRDKQPLNVRDRNLMIILVEAQREVGLSPDLSPFLPPFLSFSYCSLLSPILGNIKAPLEQQVCLLIVIHEARDRVVVAAGQHARRSLLLLDCLPSHRMLVPQAPSS